MTEAALRWLWLGAALALAVNLGPVLSQDVSTTVYRSDYEGPCRSSIRFPDAPPARYWCRVPNGRAIRVPLDPAGVEALTTVSVCALENLTRRDDAAPCGFPGAVVLWEGAPDRDLEISHAGSAFGEQPALPDEIFVAVQLSWDGVFPDAGNFFSIEYGNESRAMRTMRVRLEGEPSSATLTPDDPTIRIGEAGYVRLLEARKSANASWFPQGEAMLVGGGRIYYLSRGAETRVPAGDYELRTNGYLPQVENAAAAGFLELEVEYETGP